MGEAMSKRHLATWQIDGQEATDSPTQAASQALIIQRDSESAATMFDVLNRDTRKTAQIDLLESASEPGDVFTGFERWREQTANKHGYEYWHLERNSWGRKRSPTNRHRSKSTDLLVTWMDRPMTKAQTSTEILDVMGDNIRDEILSAFRAIEQLGASDVEVDGLLADRLLDVLMDLFPDRFPELQGRAATMYAANGGKVPTSVWKNRRRHVDDDSFVSRKQIERNRYAQPRLVCVSH
jgi:hypothetical protein